MARFDVFRFDSKSAPLVVDVQADVLNGFGSRVVVPLASASKVGKEEMPRLKPKISLDGKDYILMATDISAVPVSRLGPHVTSIEAEYRDQVSAALDFLFYGF